MSENKDIEPFQDDTSNIIVKTLTNLAEGLTGVATSSKSELILSVSHTFQRMRGGMFLSTFLEEWNRYREKGKVKDDYQFSEQHQVCLQELLEFLDKDSPDEVRFEVLQKIFLVAASEEVSDRSSFLPQQLMKIARDLSGGEIVLLSTVWKIVQEGAFEANQHYGATKWLAEVTEASGLEHQELIEIYEQELMDKKLLTPRLHGDRSGVRVTPYFRLSSLGYKFCEYIQAYEE
ncbi:hypothetical protein [Porticoccus sp.]|uniref:hypothetical protein n=1 Tax=Porticoccus sp. TaxID=2024853 RepID=UPI000C39234B|nr:hypothetical protein [Porticoccus sp.]MAZ70124.1 hypothetical protein [Porticoccus sp.]|tara:strand:+ start:1223 stop:1921 length:699 start_codon:yes stop_codon:yes gene_type:complete